MTKIMEDVDTHVQAGGSLALFPEGQLNKTPAKLQSFRRGSFSIALKYSMNMVAIVLGSGTTKCWPRSAPVGGIPASIDIKLLSIKVPKDATDNITLSEACHQQMQAAIDEMYPKEL